MLVKDKKLVMSICLLVSSLFATLGCGLLNSPSGSNTLRPVRSLSLTIDKNQRERLFDQLQKFANEHAFKLVLTEYEKTENFSVEIWGDDILITADDVPPDPTLVYIAFYGKYPGAPVDEEALDDLANDLKGFINEIPGVTVSEQ